MPVDHEACRLLYDWKSKPDDHQTPMVKLDQEVAMYLLKR